MRTLLILSLLSMAACSSIPKLKDFNRVNVGMTKQQLFKQLGEPKTTRMVDGREILEYDASDSGETKPRLVVMQDNEVIFVGRPSEYVAPVKPNANGSAGGGSATVNVTSSPVITINQAPPAVALPVAAQPTPAYSPSYQAPPNNADLHEANCTQVPVQGDNYQIIGYQKQCFGAE